MMIVDSAKYIWKKRLTVFLVVSVVLVAGCTPNLLGDSKTTSTEKKPAAPPAPVVVNGVRTSYADIVGKTTPAVVQITATVRKGEARKTNSPFGNRVPQNQQQQAPRRGFGSGVIVSEDGTILTNHHVIKDADKIVVELKDQKTYEAKVIGFDPPSDLAVLKIEGKEFPFLTLGDSEKVRVGDIVLAIGNPLGIGQSVTSGIISAKGRQTMLGNGSFQDFLQTDAPINQGNSGGALVNVNGELVGINSQILSRSGGNIGIGFSIPSNMAKSVMKQLIENGKVRRGMLGVEIRKLDKDDLESLNLKNTTGVLVNKVQDNSAAGKAGIKRYDIITAIDGEKIENGNSLRNKVASTKPGTEITLKIVRNEKEMEIKVTLGEFATKKPSADSSESGNTEEPKVENDGKFGFDLQPLSPELAQKLRVDSKIKGVIITKIKAGSPAAEKGLRIGDIISEINRVEVLTLEEVRSALNKSNGKAVLLLIIRGEQTFTTSIRPEK